MLHGIYVCVGTHSYVMRYMWDVLQGRTRAVCVRIYMCVCNGTHHKTHNCMSWVQILFAILADLSFSFVCLLYILLLLSSIASKTIYYYYYYY